MPWDTVCGEVRKVVEVMREGEIMIDSIMSIVI
jgi:hypothetical protein